MRSGPDDAGRTGQRGAAEHRAHLLAEAATRHQRKPLDLVGELVEELHRDPAAERVADERRRLDADRGQKVADHRRVGADRVVAANRGGVTVADQVGNDTVCVSASRSATSRQCFDEFTIPWTITTGGPEPAVR